MISKTLFESFNASSTSIQDLCNNFIENESFIKVASPGHVVMVGPRGSGKTTLLRMLQVDSLDQWNASKATFDKSTINYSGVFIPTDRFWKIKYNEIKDKNQSDERVLSILNLSFVYHVLDRLIAIFRYRTDRQFKDANRFRFASLDKSMEVELVTELDKLWHIGPETNTLRSFAAAVVRKKDFISKSSKEPSSVVGGFLFPNPTELLSEVFGTIKLMNLYLNEEGAKWALLFDELELAPEPILTSLLDSMRGGSSSDVILKLALSPYHSGIKITKNVDAPMENQDFTFLNLGGLGVDAGEAFSKSLCESIFNKHGLSLPIESYFEGSKKPNKTREETKLLFESLAGKDASFVKYLNRKKINLEDISSYRESAYSQIRKIQFIVEIRDYYFKNEAKSKDVAKDKDVAEKGSRRRPPNYYAGFENICKALEYNPRMLTGIMNNFVAKAKNKPIISSSDQLEELKGFYESFRSLLRTIFVESKISSIVSVYDFIEILGKYFESEMLGDEFKPEPHGTIKFTKLPDHLHYLVPVAGLTLNSGALVITDNKYQAEHGFENLESSRCRLSYLFSHVFSLTLTIQGEVDLSTIIESVNHG